MADYSDCSDCADCSNPHLSAPVGTSKQPTRPAARRASSTQPQPGCSLAETHPQLAAEWHLALNGATPSDITARSNEAVHWHCLTCGHGEAGEWRTRIARRVQEGTGCRRCSSRAARRAAAIPAPGQSFADVKPEYAAEWHPELNDCGPDAVKPGANYRAHFICSACDYGRDGEWCIPVGSRRGCPACTGRVVTATNNLAHLHPDVAAEWHPDRNDRAAHEVGPGSNYRAWWLCSSCGHGRDGEWRTQVVKRACGSRSGCPACRLKEKQTPPRGEDLAALRPDLAAQWHPDLNDRTPDTVYPSSNLEAFWVCPCGFGTQGEWRKKPSARSGDEGVCRSCARARSAARRARPAEGESLLAARPDLAAQWHPTLNDRTPAQVRPGSNIKACWICPDCSHGANGEWRAQVRSRAVDGHGCRRCRRAKSAKARTYPKAGQGLADLHADVAAQWHPTLNTRTAGEVFPSSKIRAFWQCADCGHGAQGEWSTQVVRRAQGKAPCPACSAADRWVIFPDGSRAKRVPASQSLAATHPHLAREWDLARNVVPADQILAGTGYRAYWTCGDCGYGSDGEWRAPTGVRASQGNSCPACADVQRRRSRATAKPGQSLADLRPDLLAEWVSPVNAARGLDPHAVNPFTHRDARWRCRTCTHEWDAEIASRASGVGCPGCRGLAATPTNCLAATHPEIARMFDDGRNAPLTAKDVVAGSQKPVWWRCTNEPELHRWQNLPQQLAAGIGCPMCDNEKWTTGRARRWLQANVEALSGMSAEDRRALARWEGLLATPGPARIVGELVILDEFPTDELAAFAAGDDDGVVAEMIDEHNPREFGGRKGIPESVRRAVFERDGHQCQNPFCDTPPERIEREGLALDHVVAHARGGSDEMDNLQALCVPCNARKTNRRWHHFLERERARTGASADG